MLNCADVKKIVKGIINDNVTFFEENDFTYKETDSYFIKEVIPHDICILMSSPIHLNIKIYAYSYLKGDVVVNIACKGCIGDKSYMLFSDIYHMTNKEGTTKYFQKRFDFIKNNLSLFINCVKEEDEKKRLQIRQNIDKVRKEAGLGVY